MSSSSSPATRLRLHRRYAAEVYGRGEDRGPGVRLVSPQDQGRIFATAVDTCTTYLRCSLKRVAGEDDDDIVAYELGDTHGAANDMQAVVIRQVSGPALRGPARWITHGHRH